MHWPTPDEYRQFARRTAAAVPWPWRVPAGVPGEISSEAFRRAALQSERRRVVALLVLLGALAVIALVRGMLRPQPGERIRALGILGFLLAGAIYELGILWIIRRAQRKSQPTRGWVWTLNALVECSIPSLALLLLTLDRYYLGPYRALVAPSVLIYCFFIVLSTLRLSPALCVFSGAVSAVGYVAVLLFTRARFPHDHSAAAMPAAIFWVYPAMIFCVGLLAAGVAGEIRRHVVAALKEAETRLRLERIESDLRIARSIQMGLLPKRPPAVPGYEIAGWSKPADQTGGDYYDWMELPGGRVLLTIADASGHGIGPAMLSTSCRAYFRAVARTTPAAREMTSRVDDLISHDVPAGRFVTAAVAMLSPAEHQVSLYSAGHAPSYLYTAATESIVALDADQPPLGLGAADGDAQTRTLALAPGDALVLLTDGFFECTDPAGTQLGTRRLGDAIRQNQHLPAPDLIARLHQEVVSFTHGSPQADDLTMVVVRRKASAAVTAHA